VLVLAVIHDPADGRIRLGSDLDQVEIGFSGNGQGLGQGKNADLLAIRTDQPHLASADAVVDPGFVVGRRSYRRSLLIDAQTPPSHVFPGLVDLASGPKTTTRTPGSRRPLRADPLRPIDPDAHGPPMDRWPGGDLCGRSRSPEGPTSHEVVRRRVPARNQLSTPAHENSRQTASDPKGGNPRASG